MKFLNLVAILAISMLAVQANAADGGLRRIAQNEEVPSQGVVIMNSNTSTAATQTTQQAVQQPNTVVEANPVIESKAEAMRRARQGAEVSTEQKIVEKLEDSRLQDERNRADRLFGDRLDSQAPVPAPQPQPVAPAQPVQQVVVPAPTPVPVQPVNNVTIEKVEIIQPKEEAAPVAESKMEAPAESTSSIDKSYVGAIVGNSSYDASNVKSNYALGVAIGTILENNWGVEGSFIYSSHEIDQFWNYNLYSEVEQYDFNIAGKYYLLPGRLKPYIGAQATYIYRQYQDRAKNNDSWYQHNQTKTTEETSAVNLGVLAGLDFQISESFLLGAGMSYSRNVMNKSQMNLQSYGLPSNARPLEEFDMYTFMGTAKVTF